MSRLCSWCLAFVAFANLAPVTAACPGSMLLGLPLLFGPEDPVSSWPSRMAIDAVPVVSLPADLDEAQEHRDPPTRKEQAQESLKVWRQLVRDGRFSAAAIVAAKAASLDPTNIEVQQAVMVSQQLKAVGEHPKTEPLKCCGPCPSECVLCPMAELALKQMFPKGLLAPDDAKAKSRTCTCKDVKVEKEGCPDQTKEVDTRAGFALKRLFPSNIFAGTGSSEIRTVAHAEARPAKERISIKTARWQIECDRATQPNDREMILEGNVTMRHRDIAIDSGRIRLNLVDGTIQIAP